MAAEKAEVIGHCINCTETDVGRRVVCGGRIGATRIWSGPYGARTLSITVHFVPCIKIGAGFFTKKYLNIFELLLQSPLIFAPFLF
jgi:hypothetical protein